MIKKNISFFCLFFFITLSTISLTKNTENKNHKMSSIKKKIKIIIQYVKNNPVEAAAVLGCTTFLMIQLIDYIPVLKIDHIPILKDFWARKAVPPTVKQTATATTPPTTRVVTPENIENEQKEDAILGISAEKGETKKEEEKKAIGTPPLTTSNIAKNNAKKDDPQTAGPAQGENKKIGEQEEKTINETTPTPANPKNNPPNDYLETTTTSREENKGTKEQDQIEKLTTENNCNQKSDSNSKTDKDENIENSEKKDTLEFRGGHSLAENYNQEADKNTDKEIITQAVNATKQQNNKSELNIAQTILACGISIPLGVTIGCVLACIIDKLSP
jgi:hypothetical protein